MSVIGWIDWSKYRNYGLIAHIAKQMLCSSDENERAEGIRMKEILEKEGYDFGRDEPVVM